MYNPKLYFNQWIIKRFLMDSTLIVVQFILGILITITVLLQKSSSVGLGAYGGSNESVFGAKGASGFLVKVTVVLSALFVLNTVTLAYLYSSGKDNSVVDSVKLETPAAPANAATGDTPPSPPAIPAAPSN